MADQPLSPQECEQRFWLRFGPFLFGEKRKPQSAQEWLDAGRQLRGLQHFDEMAQRLEQAIKAAPPLIQRPQARQQHPEAGSVYYNDAGEPCCPQHERPLKEGRYGLYCSAKDPNGKNGYCNFKIKDA